MLQIWSVPMNKMYCY